jgi:hypothetical protein
VLLRSQGGWWRSRVHTGVRYPGDALVGAAGGTVA